MADSLKIKEKVKERYATVALTGDSCCSPSAGVGEAGTGGGCCTESNILQPLQSPEQVSELVGYDTKELESIPEASILGAGCGTPTKFAYIKEGDTVVDLGSGAGIDVFLAANIAKGSGRVIGIDMTDEMLEKSRKNAAQSGYANVEFRKGDIEEKIPVDDNSVDFVISNCVINLTSNKTNTFKEIYRILKINGKARMIISDLITTKEISKDNEINTNNWCSCIDGALTKENYLQSIKDAGFQNIEILNEKTYMDENSFNDRRKIVSIIVKAI